MGARSRWVTIALAGGLLCGGARAIDVYARGQGQAPAQGFPTEITQIRFNAGQSVIPYFEGWIRNPDGTFDMVFGYFNRNWQQELAIPAGPDNRVEPNGPDSGQPTYFLPRRHRFVFRVRVPADFGKKEVVWTITSNGRTESGFGNLLPEQEITERVVMTNGNFNPGHGDPNTPPSITLAPVRTASVGTPLALTASVVDDGLPKPRVAPPAAPRPATPTGGQVNFGAQVNSSGGGRPRGLTVTWLLYRGPSKVTFENAGPIPVTNGQAATTARFAAPGTYKLIGTANDGAMSRKTELTVTVTAGPSSDRP
jgi:hypothetical protein